MQKAITDKASGIVKRLTTQVDHIITEDEEIISLPSPIDLKDGPFKVVNGEVQQATQEEVDSAGLNEDLKTLEANEAQKQAKLLASKLSTDNTLSKDLKAFFEYFSKLL